MNELTTLIGRELAANNQVTLIENLTCQQTHLLTRNWDEMKAFIKRHGGETFISVQALKRCKHCNSLMVANWVSSWKLECKNHHKG
jgi:hypothetical protein